MCLNFPLGWPLFPKCDWWLNERATWWWWWPLSGLNKHTVSSKGQSLDHTHPHTNSLWGVACLHKQWLIDRSHPRPQSRLNGRDERRERKRERLTCNSLMATQEFSGKPWSIGTRNWRQPLQCPINSIMHIKLNIFMKTLAILRNCRCHWLIDWLMRTPSQPTKIKRWMIDNDGNHQWGE